MSTFLFALVSLFMSDVLPILVHFFTVLNIRGCSCSRTYRILFCTFHLHGFFWGTSIVLLILGYDWGNQLDFTKSSLFGILWIGVKCMIFNFLAASSLGIINKRGLGVLWARLIGFLVMNFGKRFFLHQLCFFCLKEPLTIPICLSHPLLH